MSAWMNNFGGFFSGGANVGAAEGSAASASDDDDEVAVDGAGAKAVTFQLDEEESVVGECDGGRAVAFDSMALMTQPDDSAEGDLSSSSSSEPEDTPHPKKGRGGGRARKQIGDPLTQLPKGEKSPEGRQHSSTIKRSGSASAAAAAPGADGKQLGNLPSLSQSVVDSPLRSPSPLMFSQPQEMEPSRSPAGHAKEEGVKDDVVSAGLKDDGAIRCPPVQSSNDAMDVDSSDINYDHENHDEGDAEFEAADPAMDDAPSEEDQQQQRLVHKMNMKKQAIYRSLLHLSDNSYSFVYGDAAENGEPMNDDDEPGLPYIGPCLRKDYELLRSLLRKGLLGITEDDVGAEAAVEDGSNAAEEHDVQSATHPDDSNPFLSKIKANVSAVLMGPRGHGKSLILERCLASLSRLAAKRKERILERLIRQGKVEMAEEMYSQASFRVVRLNGLLFQGSDSVVACTREIARQIGVMSREERRRTRRVLKQMGVKRKRAEGGTPRSSRKERKRDRSSRKGDEKKAASTADDSPAAVPSGPGAQTPDNPANDESHDLRVRRSGFNTYIALLDEVLRTARIDGIPILIVLEELDTFLAGGATASGHNDASDGGSMLQDGGSSDRQLLLYHLLDRVADHKFLVSLVGMTTDLTAVTKLEKRVQSRAEGTSKLFYIGHNEDYDGLVQCLLGKFYSPPDTGSEYGDDHNERGQMLDIREEVEAVLRGRQSNESEGHAEEEAINDFALVQRVLLRNYNLLGSDMRWICRVFDVALGLLASDIDESISQCMEGGVSPATVACIPKLSPSHVAQALVVMSASLDDIAGGVGRPGIPTQRDLELIRWGQLLGDPKHYSCLLGTHPRLISLLDLSGPQVAVLLAARRIGARDDARANAEDEIEEIRRRGPGTRGGAVTALSLTYQRIEDEYRMSFVASGSYTISSDRYPPHVLHRSCVDLMELDIIRLKKDICCGGALQYVHNDAISFGTNMANLPLHVNLDWELEFMGPLKAGLLQCSTALREWGMKMNS